MFAIVDCNNFYASCERVFNPSLIGKPIVVLSNNDGCVIARSNEAKELGIKMGEPAFKIEEFLTTHKVAVFSSNYALYGDMSQRVMDNLSQFTNEIEFYSIDEAFLNLKGIKANLTEYANKIRQQVFQNTGIPVSIGIAPTKSLAKVANRLAKKNPENGGIFILDNEEKIAECLKIIDVSDIWGIGRQYSIFLKNNNILTGLDFVNADDNWVKKNLKIVGLRTKKELSSISCIPMELFPSPKKNICTSRSFGETLSSIDGIEEAVSTFASRCALKLRKQKSCAKAIMVFVHTNQFSSEPQYARNRVIELPVATNSSIEIIKFALFALRSIFKEGYKYKKAGVIVSEIIPEDQVQISMFDNLDRDKHKKLMAALDSINGTFGKEKLKIASQGNGRKWKLRQEKLSPFYTTRWSDIIKIKI